MTPEDLLLDRIKLLETRVEMLDKKIDVTMAGLSNKIDGVSKDVANQNVTFWKYLATTGIGIIGGIGIQFVVQFVHIGH